MADRAILIELKDISFSYPGSKKILDGLDFQLHAAEKIGLVGANGSGKSTFLQLIMGLLTPASGQIRIFDRRVETAADFHRARQQIGFVFQHADDQLFSPTVLEDVAFGPLNLGKSAAEAVAMARATLAALNLQGFEDRLTHKLSGGEKKLVSLATVLVMKPRVLLLDEPTTGLDEETVVRIRAILASLEVGMVIVSHEHEFLTCTTRQIRRMKDGRIV